METMDSLGSNFSVVVLLRSTSSTEPSPRHLSHIADFQVVKPDRVTARALIAIEGGRIELRQPLRATEK